MGADAGYVTRSYQGSHRRRGGVGERDLGAAESAGQGTTQLAA